MGQELRSLIIGIYWSPYKPYYLVTINHVTVMSYLLPVYQWQIMFYNKKKLALIY